MFVKMIIIILTNKLYTLYYHNTCTLIVAISLLYISGQFWCQLPEDGEIKTPKHVGAM
jgi:hypothetical protein